MTANPVKRLKESGQAIWYDNIRRELVTSGELAGLIADYGVTGITSNPVIFEKAISKGAEYDPDIGRLVAEGRDADGILTELTTTDIRLAADVLRPVYDSTGGLDGYVSIEVSPYLAYDAEGTVKEALRLYDLVSRPNILIKVPATKEGITAVEELVYQGYNVNVTLLFDVQRYSEAALAFINGLERRLAEGKPVKGLTGVASFFVSRVDTLIDGILEEKARSASHGEKSRIQALVGAVAVANAKLAKKKHDTLFGAARYLNLKEAGAGPQRLLWASTGTKNPLYSDIKYVEGLVGEGTVNTMPLETLLAFADHGTAAPTLDAGLAGAEKAMEELGALGVEYAASSAKLEEDGVNAFKAGHDGLIRCLTEKIEAIAAGPAGGPAPEIEYFFGEYAPAVDSAIKALAGKDFALRLDARDPTLWKDDPADKKLIKNSLGWLALPEEMWAQRKGISAFAEEVRASGITEAVLLGMGGSSLAPLVLADTLGGAEGAPRLTVLDTTDPEAVAVVAARITAETADKFLFIFSSKSGTTIEPLSLFEFFHEKISGYLGDKAGRQFMAVTDPGTALEGFAKRFGFRHVFKNPSDIGGRFSALSYFGLVPAAIAGIDISGLLSSAYGIKQAVDPCVEAAKNPGLALGAALGALALAGRDKVTFFVSEPADTFGLWIEQLVAESTGKEGKGIVPISGEPLSGPEAYGPDRVFVDIVIGEPDRERAERIGALKGAGHPVITIRLKEAIEIGGEFFRWEVATAAAGVILGINPFDQPDVELAKKMTIALLDTSEAGAGPKPSGVELAGGSIKGYFSEAAEKRLADSGAFSARDLPGSVRDLLGTLKEGDYVGLLAYLNPFDPVAAATLETIRGLVFSTTRAATQMGYGPRYLHSTGQLHKGGADNGVFIVITHAPTVDLDVPGRPFSFSVLELSQAYGDTQALVSRGRSVLLLNLKDSAAETLSELATLFKASAGV